MWWCRKILFLWSIRVDNMYRRNVSTALGLFTSSKTSYRKISWSLEAARLDIIMIVLLWNLTGISAALLPRCLSNLRAIGKVFTRIPRLRDFMRSCCETSVRLVNRGPGPLPGRDSCRPCHGSQNNLLLSLKLYQERQGIINNKRT